MSDKIKSPFAEAEWGETEILHELRWVPKPGAGMVFLCVGKPSAYYHELTSNDKTMIKDTFVPLLPSPDLINQQPNPRKVATAALERAGATTEYKKTDSPDLMEILLHGTASIWIEPRGDNLIELWFENLTDPTLAQYAVDCFKVLKAWCDKINWKQEA